MLRPWRACESSASSVSPSCAYASRVGACAPSEDMPSEDGPRGGPALYGSSTAATAHRLRLAVAAGIESCSGDWRRPILRFSFCKGVHIPFVKHLSSVTECVCVCSCHRLKFGPLGEPLLLIGEHQNPRKIVFWGIKSRNFFWPAGAGLTPVGGGGYISHDGEGLARRGDDRCGAVPPKNLETGEDTRAIP